VVATSASKNLPLRFGVFELDPETGELRKSGRAVKLRPQAAKVLVVLASRPGQLVTREVLQEQLWDKKLSLTLNTALICASGRSDRHWATMPLHHVMWRHCLDTLSLHRTIQDPTRRKLLEDIV